MTAKGNAHLRKYLTTLHKGRGKGERRGGGVASLSVVWLLVHLPATAIGNPNGNAFLHLVANA